METAALAFEVPAGPRRAPKLSALQKKGLAALHELVKAEGKPLPTGDGFPAEATAGVEVTAWRKECARRGMSDAEDPKARSRAFKRMNEGLQSAGMIETRDGWAWSIR
jgi:hypothetical protein